MKKPEPRRGRLPRPCGECPHWPKGRRQGWCPLRAEYRIDAAPSCEWGRKLMRRRPTEKTAAKEISRQMADTKKNKAKKERQ